MNDKNLIGARLLYGSRQARFYFDAELRYRTQCVCAASANVDGLEQMTLWSRTIHCTANCKEGNGCY